MDRDYAGIREALCRQHKILREAAAFAPGIRILRQDPWEALCSFILSQNNHIPRIKGIIQRLCGQFGPPGEDGPGFPSPQRLAGLSLEDLAPLRSGFRAKYLLSAARLVTEGAVDLQALQTLPLPQARLCLQQIAGGGSQGGGMRAAVWAPPAGSLPAGCVDETGHAGMVPAGKARGFWPLCRDCPAVSVPLQPPSSEDIYRECFGCGGRRRQIGILCGFFPQNP